MNIFVLSENPIRAAEMQHDKHVVKMVLESAQMLCSAYTPEQKPPYRQAYFNHPCTKWARTSRENYKWLLIHAVALSNEYTYRYSKIHASYKVIKWCWEKCNIIDFPELNKTDHPLAMPKEYKTDDAVESYVNYYLGEKLNNARWTKRKKPDIFNIN
tara:strand:+ start:249 stop:719 length:471 start_codon:yes stop_codon:yes gene_type:complete